MAHLTDYPVGFGTFLLTGEECINAVSNAIRCGYRHIDTAQSYQNEAEIGCAINECIAEGIVSRKDLFLVSKINPHKPIGYQEAIDAVQSSLEKLGVDYIDLYMIHYPNNAPSAKWKKLNAETWRGLEECYRKGWIKNLGVSNFNIHHLEVLLKTAEIKPIVNQLHLSPIWQQKELVQFCKRNNIYCVAWSPLVRFIDRVSCILEDDVWESEDWTQPLMKNLANKYKKSEAQIAIRWSVQKGYIPLVKSAHLNRMKENLDVFDFEIEQADMDKLDDLNARPSCPEAEFDSICTTWAFSQKNTEIKYVAEDNFKLFKLPLCKKKRINDVRSKIYLFGFIPIIDIVSLSGDIVKYYLFKIPFLKKYSKGIEKEKYYVFSFLPFLTRRKTIKKEGYAINLVPDYRPQKVVFSKFTDFNKRLYYRLYELYNIFNKKQLSTLFQHYLNLRALVFRKISIASIDVHMTTICNYKCQNCPHCIPYYKKEHQHVMNFCEFKAELDVILKNVDLIFNLFLSGGEPLLNEDLEGIIAYLESLKQVKNVFIVTNGSIFPKESLLKQCRMSKKLMFLIENFSKNKSIDTSITESIIERLEKDGIKYYYEKDKTYWKKCPKIDLNKISASEQIEDNFAKCDLKYQPLWSGGKIYPCIRSRYINDEKGQKYNCEFIDLSSVTLSPKDFKKFFKASKYTVCQHCSLEHCGEILLPAVQLKK